MSTLALPSFASFCSFPGSVHAVKYRRSPPTWKWLRNNQRKPAPSHATGLLFIHSFKFDAPSHTLHNALRTVQRSPHFDGGSHDQLFSDFTACRHRRQDGAVCTWHVYVCSVAYQRHAVILSVRNEKFLLKKPSLREGFFLLKIFNQF